MRTLSFFFLFLFVLTANAEEFFVFEKDGYFGIKDVTGNVTVPAVYETLGWSDGTKSVKNGVIGYREGKLWGLINVRNKALTDQKFYTLTPLTDGFFKAAIKGRFSNYLFHGIIDDKGKTIISCSYFSIRSLGINWLVSKFDGKKEKFGVVSFDNQSLIPPNYQSISERNGFYLAETSTFKVDIYSARGEELGYALDSLHFDDGWIMYRDGYAGFLDSSGKQTIPVDFKSVSVDREGPHGNTFPKWDIYEKGSLLFSWSCDSLSIAKEGLLVAYLNGANHLIKKEKAFDVRHDVEIKDISANHMLVQNLRTRQWSAIAENGRILASDYDSIYAIRDKGFVARKGNRYHLLNEVGKPLPRQAFDMIYEGVKNQLVIKKNNYWGIISVAGAEKSAPKYDSIIANADNYFVAYLNRWGILGTDGRWILRPEYAEVFSFGSLSVGRKGKGYSLFHDSKFISKTTDRPIRPLGSFVLFRGDQSKFRLYSSLGIPLGRSYADRVSKLEDYYVFESDDVVSIADSKGAIILSPNAGFEEVSGFSEGMFLIRKEGRSGFLDKEGRLVISHRYDDARPFSEQRAAIKLRSKWGFIDNGENLKIQPYYDEVSSFFRSLAIVRQNDRFGLIDNEGEEVVELKWKSILRLETGNYLVEDIDGKFGLVDDQGTFILRATYDHLEDTGSEVIVSKNGKWGLLEYSGEPRFEINHKEIKSMGSLILVRD